MSFFSAYERRVFRRCILLGMCAALLITGVEWAGGLDWLENLLFDQRTAQFQRHSTIPQSRVVLVDLDDGSVGEIGKPPWQRSVIAGGIDEITRAGAKCIATDILFDERSADPWEDQRLSESIAASGRVVLCLAIKFEGQSDRSAVSAALERALENDPEQSPDALADSLAAQQKVSENHFGTEVRGEYFRALDSALLTRLERDYPADIPAEDEVALRMTPRAPRGLTTVARVELAKQYDRFLALRAASKHQIVSPDVSLLSGEAPQIPDEPFLSGAAQVGFVDFLPNSDGTVRSLPLLARLRGRTFVQLTLATACLAEDIPLSTIHLEGDTLVAGAPGGKGFSIPIRTRIDPRFGKVATIADAFFQGRRDDWLTMYDAPNYRVPASHISFRDVYSVVKMDQDVAKNQATIESAMEHLLSRTGSNDEDKVAQFRKEWPHMSAVARRQLIEKTLADRRIAFFLRSVDRDHPETWTDGTKRLIANMDIVRTLPAINEQLLASSAAQRQSLRRDIQGKIVMLGWTATATLDTYKTSLHAQCPGVVIQSAMINGILASQIKQRTGPIWRTMLSLIAGIVATSMCARFRPVAAAEILLAVLLCYCFLNGSLLFDRYKTVVPLAGVLTQLSGVYFVITPFRYVLESRERARVERRFRAQVDPRVVNYFLEHPELSGLRGEQRELSVVFTDIQGFSALSERLKEKIVPIINDYMGRMMPVIREHEGTWDKFIGDGIMFFFNAPLPTERHPSKAIATVLQMHRETAKLADELEARGLPRIAMRAGVTTGQMIVGDAGSLNENFFASSYTVLGDLVNLASRLEAANKFFGTRTMVLRETMLAADEYLFRPIARLRVYGKNEIAETFEPIALRTDASPGQQQLAAATVRIADCYRSAQFQACIEEIARAEEALGTTPLWTFYREQIAGIKIEPGTTFDGAFNLSGK